MENRFIVIDVTNLTPKELEDKMNELHRKGYERAMQSDISWYQGKGLDGVIVFEAKDCITPSDVLEIADLASALKAVNE